jgi:hypothetical protein
VMRDRLVNSAPQGETIPKDRSGLDESRHLKSS